MWQNECNELKKAVCDKDAASLACEKAGQLTARDECANYLANLDKFIELSNVVVEEPGFSHLQRPLKPRNNQPQSLLPTSSRASR